MKAVMIVCFALMTLGGCRKAEREKEPLALNFSIDGAVETNYMVKSKEETLELAVGVTRGKACFFEVLNVNNEDVATIDCKHQKHFAAGWSEERFHSYEKKILGKIYGTDGIGR